MIRNLIWMAFAGCLAGAGVAAAQEELHCEGMAHGLSVSAPGDTPAALGLVTSLFPPLTSNFVMNEYTWKLAGLVSRGSTSSDGKVFSTDYDVTHATLTIYEDPSQDARPTYYNCPAGAAANDPAYGNGTVYLSGPLASFSTSYDSNAGSGSMVITLNWDGGEHLGELSPGRRAVSPPGEHLTLSTTFACIPLGEGYTEAVTARFFEPATPAPRTTWGQLRKMYR